ncbi:hypothetical protein KUCAC02_026524 [Chaenocephalus aceratus]|nr:hypothetical protein KUCAC02_026524 [Chaenocephalus aceratus]
MPKQLPPHPSGLVNKLCDTGRLFIEQYERKVVDWTLNTLRQVKKLLDFMFTLTRITPTADDDATLRDFIAHSALRCEKTVLEFSKMRNTLRDYEEKQAK